MPITSKLVDFACKQAIRCRSNDGQKATPIILFNPKIPGRPNYGIVIGQDPAIAPVPWQVGLNMDIVDKELDDFIFVDQSKGILRREFKTLVITLTWGSNSVKPSNYWQLPGSRIKGKTLPLGNLATGGVHVSYLVYRAYLH